MRQPRILTDEEKATIQLNIYIDVETDRDAEQVYSNYLKVFTANKPKENQKVFLCLNIDYEQPWF